MLLGLVSDTHGLLRDEAVRALQGVDRIVHAGDIGEPSILDIEGGQASARIHLLQPSPSQPPP